MKICLIQPKYSTDYSLSDYYFEEEFQAGKYPADSGFYCIRLFHRFYNVPFSMDKSTALFY